MAGKKIEVDLIIDTADAADSIKDIKGSIKELDDAASGMSLGSEEFEKLNKKSEELKGNLKGIGKGLGDVGDDAKKGLGGVSKGFKGVGAAIKVAGIGLVIGLFAALKEVLEQQQPVLDLVDTTFTAIGLAINEVSRVLTEAFKANSESNGGFEATTKIIKNLVTIGLAPLKLAFNAIKAAVVGAQLVWEKSFFGDGDEAKIAELEQSLSDIGDEVIEIGKGVGEAAVGIVQNVSAAADEITNLVGDVVDGISEIDAAAIVSAAERTTALKNSAQIAEAVNQGILEDYDRQAELQRQIRDDEFKSIGERTAANEALGLILKAESELLQENAAIGVEAAQAALAANNTTENRVALITAQNEQLAIAATVTGLQSEQLVNQTALQKEANEINQIAIDSTVARATAEREFAAEQLATDALQLERKLANVEIDKELELARIQAIIDNAPLETEARAAAEALFLEAEQTFNFNKIELEKQYQDSITKAANEAEDKRQKKRAAGIQSTKDGINSVGSLTADVFAIADNLGEQDEKSKEARARKAFNTQKALNLGLAVIDGFKAITTSLSLSPVAIGPIPNPAGIASLAFAAVTSAANIAKIASSKFQPSGGGGGTVTAPTPSISTITTPADAPTLAAETLVQTPTVDGDVESAGSGAGINQQPIRAVVLEADITNTQNTLQTFQEQSEIGG